MAKVIGLAQDYGRRFDTEVSAEQGAIVLNVPVPICTRYVAGYAPRNFHRCADPFQPSSRQHRNDSS